MYNVYLYRTVHEDPSSIRGCFGLTDTRNLGHGCGNFSFSRSNSTIVYVSKTRSIADSVQSFEQELPLFFTQEFDTKNVVSRDQLYNLVFLNFENKSTMYSGVRETVNM